MSRIILMVFAMLLVSLQAISIVDNIMPAPKQVKKAGGSGFKTCRSVAISDPTASSELLRFTEDAHLVPSDTAKAHIIVKLCEVAGLYDYYLPHYAAEGYVLDVGADTIKINAPDACGVIRAAQTLRQMAEGSDSNIEAVRIIDWPAFKLRGFMHDIGRSFLPYDELEREIDLLSRFKVNTFHWHLTDNTGWRLAIDAYPQLTGDKAITRDPGKFYTKSEARRLQDFAAERGVIIIPEIDLPGHSGPFERAMGHSMQTPEGIAELKIILAEVAEVFDKAPYIHIGGDEVKFADEYLVDMIDYVHSLGKKVVIWNRYNRPPKPVDPARIPCDMTTNWATNGTVSYGIPNVDMRYNYTNHFDVFADIVGIYKSSIFNMPAGTPDIAGTISAAWNDTKTPTYADIIRQNNMYAAILASAERAWKGGGEQYIEQGGTSLPFEGPEFEEFADWERRFLHHKATTLADVAVSIPYVRQTDVCWSITEQMPNGGNTDAILPPDHYVDAYDMPEFFCVDGAEYDVLQARGAGIYLKHIWHPVVKGLYESPADSVTAYAWTYIYSPVAQDAGALIEFYTYSRSGNEKAPPAGRWDRRGSRIWLNGNEICAPEWQQPDAYIRQDDAYDGLTNENLTNRRPVAIHLNQGWNKVFMKLPHVNSGGTGRDKWQFTFVVTDVDGHDALDGIIYSPVSPQKD